MVPESLQSQEKEFIISLAKRILPIKAISPESGGTGESERADEICKILQELKFEKFQRYDIVDERGVNRPNIVLKVGHKSKTFWIVSHIDTVPEGDPSLWSHHPFDATVEGDKIYGRGSSDNGQAIFLSLLLLKKLNLEKLKFNLGLAFVADEEMGSKYGIQYLMRKELFGKDDLILVPDAGTSDGLEIEIAEKSILWLRFKTSGKQYHASMPFNAINASREGMKFILSLDKSLHEKYTAFNDIFSPPYSTFEPTKREKNVDNINTIPGLDIQYLDSRILPKYDLDLVLDDVDVKIREFEKTSPAKISYDIIQKEQAPPSTSESSEVVKELKKAIKKKRNAEPKVVGIGGGTCAAFFRKKGLEAAVWSTTIPETAHQADEFCFIEHILLDRDVAEEILYGEQ